MKIRENRPWIQFGLISLLAVMGLPGSSTAQSTVMDPVGVTSLTLNPGYTAIAINMVKPVLWRGLVTAAATGSLELNGSPVLPASPCYVEIVSGPLEGDRIDVGSVAGSTVALNLAAPHNTLTNASVVSAGTQIVIRQHFVLSDFGALLGGALQHGPDSSHSDFVSFFSNGFVNYFPYLDGSWYEDFGNINLADRKILAPGSGVMYYRYPPAGAARLIVTGDVRANLMRVPLPNGIEMISTGFPISLSPADLAMSPPQFVAGDNAFNSDTIITYDNGFKNHFLYRNGTWYQDYGNIDPVSDRPLFGYSASVAFHSFGDKSLDILKPY